MLKPNLAGKYEKQLAAAYATYMMCGSYFHKTFCKNKIEEEHLRLHYLESPAAKTERLEEHFIHLMEDLPKEFLRTIAEMNCEVWFRKTKDGLFQIRFETGFEKLIINIDETGKSGMEVPLFIF